MRRRDRTALQRELAEVHQLLRAWHVYHRQLCTDAINGDSGELVSALLGILKTLTLKDGKALIEFVNSQNWHRVDTDTRQICLFAIDGAICKLREQAGLPVFDDPIGEAPANVFLTVKQMLAVREG